ncbi:acetate--CoA ligase family protein [Aeromicrobium choanae]|uniref:Acyl-CoA synthetase (NDP forming) n=1 Tax=Aeromicrobium choanae TaxID=1736691 RepID=A0A1T4Z6D4_9ACTN|nr:acetate--CoA ligase family protein [Aeromicrobium choanae]SKB09428.1 Acyl-CoA synthetase (NDP forming) [Aeromicrobium choanae]
MSVETPAHQAEHRALDPGIGALFNARRIAIVGASGREGNPFARPLQYLTEFGFDGDVFPVNPGYETLRGLRCYPDLASLPEPVDLALLMVPGAAAVELIPQVAAAGARAAVVFASGFSETGEEGVRQQAALTAAAREHGVRVIGPNCQGVLSTAHRLYGTFTAALELGPVRRGGLAYVGQSGAVGGSILSLAREQGIGISSWVSTGNQADLTTVEVARHLVEQPDTEVLALYLESAVGEAEFRDLAARAHELGRSLIVLRSATSAAGAKAAASHTGAIVGDDGAYRVAAREYGVVEASDIDDLVRLAHAHLALPPSQGPSTAVITTSGGAGSLAADKAHELGLTIDDLSADTQRRLSALVPDFGAVDNPVDVTAQIFRSSEVDDFIEVCRIGCDAPEVDAVVIALTLVTGELAATMATALADLIPRVEKPVALVWAAAREQTVKGREILREAGVPVFDSSEQAMRAIGSLRRVAAPTAPRGRPADFDEAAVRALLDDLHGTVTESQAQAVLAAAGIRTPEAHLATGPADIEALPLETDGTYVVKIQAPGIAHKTERGGVRLGLAAAEVRAVAATMLDEFAADEPQGVLVQEMVPAGVELIVGVTRTDGGLPLVTVGLGGTATELYADTATTFAPVDAARAGSLLMELKAAPLLTGFRGSAPLDVDAVADLVSRISHLADIAGPALRELEVNPVRVLDRAERPVLALDFLMTLETETA